MKSLKSLFTIGLALLALAFTTHAQSQVRAFNMTSTDIGATNSHAIISAFGKGQAEIDYLSVTSDKAGSLLTFYTAGDGVLVVTATNATQAVIYAPGTANFTAGDIVVLRHKAADTYQRLVVSSTATASVTMTGNATATVAGDVLYKLTAGPAIPVGAATVTIAVPCYRGQENKPTYLEIDGTSASQINLISGKFVVR